MKDFKNIVDSFFEKRKIEFYSVVDYSALHEINPGLLARADIAPKSAIIFLIPYYVSYPKNLSTYAASYDYHILIKDVTSSLITLLKENYPEYKFTGYGDHSPIDERHAAAASGLGILGENKLLINEKYGSYVFIADILTDMPTELLPITEMGEAKRCAGCKKCLTACPTGILRSESEKCLSAITQRKGELEDLEVEMMRKCDTVWGCDVCQRVCSYNKDVEITPIEFFHRDRVLHLTKEYVDSLSREEFEKRAFAWRGRKTIERNLELLYPEGK